MKECVLVSKVMNGCRDRSQLMCIKKKRREEKKQTNVMTRAQRSFHFLHAGREWEGRLPNAISNCSKARIIERRTRQNVPLRSKIDISKQVEERRRLDKSLGVRMQRRDAYIDIGNTG